MENEVLRGEIYLADMRKGVHSEQNGHPRVRNTMGRGSIPLACNRGTSPGHCPALR